jgi:hypothetical protein
MRRLEDIIWLPAGERRTFSFAATRVSFVSYWSELSSYIRQGVHSSVGQDLLRNCSNTHSTATTTVQYCHFMDTMVTRYQNYIPLDST